MENIDFEFNFNFTNEEITDITSYVDNFYNQAISLNRRIKFTKFILFITLIIGIFLNISYWIKTPFNLSSILMLISLIFIFILFKLIKKPIKYFKKICVPYKTKIFITDSILYREICFQNKIVKTTFKLKSFTKFEFYSNDILILIFEDSSVPICVPIKLSQEDINFNEIIYFLKSKAQQQNQN